MQLEPDVIDTILHAMYEERSRHESHPHGHFYVEELNHAISQLCGELDKEKLQNTQKVVDISDKVV